MSANRDYHATDPHRQPNAEWKRILGRAATSSQRSAALRAAIVMGATFKEIEEYLDYLEATRPDSHFS